MGWRTNRCATPFAQVRTSVRVAVALVLVGGGSAGACLAASVALHGRDAGEDAAGQQDGDTRKDAYRRINEMVSETVPAVPLAYPISAVALSSRVTGYPLAATGVAEFDRVTLSD